MLATDLRHDLVRTVLEPLDRADAAWACARYEDMQRELESILPGDGTAVTHRAVDLRYLGQEHTVTVPVERLDQWPELRRRFDDAHHRTFGYAAPDVPVQLLNLRLAVVYPLTRPEWAAVERAAGPAMPFETRMIYSARAQADVEHRVFLRQDLRAGHGIDGPAAIEEAGTTTIIDSGDRLEVEERGCLVVQVASSP
jgi:N-methylhydantoinase A